MRYLTPDQRKKNMQHIRSDNTKIETILRKALWDKGYRYRKNYKDLLGKPDIVLPKYRAAVFVNGCFWHGHQGCKWFVKPKTNTDFWNAKFQYNIERDQRNYKKLEEMGWRVFIIWECEIRHGDAEMAINSLIKQIATESYS